MYGFYQIKDENFFVGAELTQVCIGGNEIIMNFFPDGNSITVFNPKVFLADNSFIFEPLTGIRRGIRQIGKVVDRLAIKDENVAILSFSDGSEIILRDDSAEFEAVALRYGGRTVIV